MIKIKAERPERCTLGAELGPARAASVAPGTTLLQLLRDHLQLTGAKLGCDVGDCGSCTVIVDGAAVNACPMLAAQADGRQVLTIEGLAARDRMHPLQAATSRTCRAVIGRFGCRGRGPTRAIGRPRGDARRARRRARGQDRSQARHGRRARLRHTAIAPP